MQVGTYRLFMSRNIAGYIQIIQFTVYYNTPKSIQKLTIHKYKHWYSVRYKNNNFLLHIVYHILSVSLIIMCLLKDKCYNARLARYLSRCSQKTEPFYITIVTLSLPIQLNNVWSFGAGVASRAPQNCSSRCAVFAVRCSLFAPPSALGEKCASSCEHINHFHY